MIDALVEAIVGQINAETVATMMIFYIVARGSIRLMDILLNGFEQWVRNQLSSDDDENIPF